MSAHFYSALLEKDLMLRPEWGDVLFPGLADSVAAGHGSGLANSSQGPTPRS